MGSLGQANEAEVPIHVTDTEAIIQAHFAHHQKGVARINNGSYGSCPNRVLNVWESWRMRCLSQPDFFYHRELKPALLQARAAVAELIHCKSAEEVVLVDNATTGAVIVAQAFARELHEGRYPGSVGVLIPSIAYGAVRKIFTRYVESAGAILVEVVMPFPVDSGDRVLSAFEEALHRAESRGIHCKLAVVDHVSSMPAVVFPVKSIVELLRSRGVERVFVDAAHSLGNVDLDVEAMDADFSTGNLHKWLFAPPSVAFFHFKPDTKLELHHPITSHFLNQGLEHECAWIGTRDYSSMLSLKAGIDFANSFAGGIPSLMEHNRKMAFRMGEMLAAAWNTCLGAPEEMGCSMVMVGLPLQVQIRSEEDALEFRARLYDGYQVEVPIYFSASLLRSLEGNHGAGVKSVAFARISHQIYNRKVDYERMRDAVLDICQSSVNTKRTN